jgi:hypothetical protein
MDFTLSDGKLFIKGKTFQVDISKAGVNVGGKFLVDGPGEYEVGGVSIVGIVGVPVYVVEVEGLRIFAVVSESEKLTESQISEIGSIDVSWSQNLELAKQVDPWVVLTKAGPDDEKAVAKYSLTKEKLPADLQVVALTTK